MNQSKIKEYYQLTKPGIIWGNLLPAFAGFMLASKGHPAIFPLIFMLFALALIIGGSCVFNNYFDRKIDRKMSRTRQRALAQNRIAGWQAITYAVTLSAFGLFLMTFFIDIISAYIALLAMFGYVIVYGIAKRRTPYSTIVGSLAGAAPVAIGYIAVTSHIDLAAGLLFLAMALWQMPHFYAISIFRQKDYEAAKLPVMPVRKGIKTTKKHIVIYTALFILATAALTATKYTGITFLAVMVIFGGYWLNLAVQGTSLRDNVRWARRVFGTSLIMLLLFSLMLSLNAWLP